MDSKGAENKLFFQKKVSIQRQSREEPQQQKSIFNNPSMVQNHSFGFLKKEKPAVSQADVSKQSKFFIRVKDYGISSPSNSIRTQATLNRVHDKDRLASSLVKHKDDGTMSCATPQSRPTHFTNNRRTSLSGLNGLCKILQNHNEKRSASLGKQIDNGSESTRQSQISSATATPLVKSNLTQQNEVGTPSIRTVLAIDQLREDLRKAHLDLKVCKSEKLVLISKLEEEAKIRKSLEEEVSRLLRETASLNNKLSICQRVHKEYKDLLNRHEKLKYDHELDLQRKDNKIGDILRNKRKESDMLYGRISSLEEQLGSFTLQGRDTFVISDNSIGNLSTTENRIKKTLRASSISANENLNQQRTAKVKTIDFEGIYSDARWRANDSHLVLTNLGEDRLESNRTAIDKITPRFNGESSLASSLFFKGKPTITDKEI